LVLRTRALVLVALCAAALAALAVRPATAGLPYQPFTAASYWRNASAAPADPRSDAMINWLSSVL